MGNQDQDGFDRFNSADLARRRVTGDEDKIQDAPQRPDAYGLRPVCDFGSEAASESEAGEDGGQVMLRMRTFTVDVLTTPPMFMVALGLLQPERKQMTIRGYTLKDAKRRAGIE